MPTSPDRPYLAGTQSVVYIGAGAATDVSTIYSTLKGATPPAVCWDVEDGTVDREMAVDEATNLNSAGYYEDVPTIKKCTVSGLQIVQRTGGMITELTEGEVIQMAIATPGGRCIQGNFRVSKIAEKGINPKAKATVTFDCTSQLAYSVIPTPA